MESLTSEQLAQMALIEELQSYTTVSLICFKRCIKTTATKGLSPSEKTCISNCYKKIVKFNEHMAKSVSLALLERNMKNTRLLV